MSADPPLIPVSGPGEKKTLPGAVWSLVLGILSLFCLWILGSIPAIILGALSIKKAKDNPETVGGEGLALAGIITGAIGLFTGFISVGVLAAVMMPAYNKAHDRASEAKAMHNVREVAIAVIGYSADLPDGKLPESLNDVIPEFLPDESKLKVVNSDGTTSPILYRKVDYRNGVEEPMLLLKLAAPNHYILGFNDGSIQKSTTPLDPEVLNSFKE